MNQRQHRPWLPTVILVGIVALLVLFVIFVMPELNPPPEQGVQPTRVPLWEFESENLIKISVTNRLQTTTVERTGMTWRVTEPSPGDADIIRLYNLADQIATMNSRTLQGDLGDFGLAEPQADVTLGLEDGTEIVFSIGDQNPNRTDYYVRKEGDSEIHLVTAGIIDSLLQMLQNPPYPATPVPPPSPVQTATPEEVPTETPAPTEKPTEQPTEEPTETPTAEASETETPTP